ncbi:MAG: DNA-protecting protein DprA [Chloroflexi bacterium]|nr:DNA-protecting protein DprA [Chloroflexota bacterium]
MNQEIKYWVGFNIIPGIGPVRLRHLLSYFQRLEVAWGAGEKELAAAGLDSRSITSILAKRDRIHLDEEMERLEKRGVGVLTWESPDYPARLREIYDAPPVLYHQGSLVPQDEWAVAVVGTRQATAYGREVAAYLVGQLARNRVTTISGLARGIDAAAHQAALKAGGRTIAIMGSGLDTIYPAEHKALAQAIAEQGALMSELHLGARPEARNFPQRNRIMTGLSLGVLVVEAGKASGALNSVRHALEQNREVFAVPGSIFTPTSQGTNHLIQEGAKLVRHVDDILEELNINALGQRDTVGQQLEMKLPAPIEENESLVLRHLTSEPLHIDEVRRRSGLPIAVISSTLSLMELKGLVHQVGAMNYVLA